MKDRLECFFVWHCEVVGVKDLIGVNGNLHSIVIFQSIYRFTIGLNNIQKILIHKDLPLKMHDIATDS